MTGPGKSPKPPVPDSVKAELEAKATDLIENVLKPKHVLPPRVGEQFNYITDIGTKWYRNYFYFISTYACPAPNALSPTFEAKFARLEYRGAGKFALSFMRHTGEWTGMYDAPLSIHECMKAIRADDWFVP
ncbi:MAG TPA: hypothetical protein VMV69_29120 [Pirellulales bacterium]|nr:hypothetical protein [Pirellulales bacterium]